MSDTLTYNESEPSTEQVVLNEAEQEALEVGEQMAQEQETLLAGKFSDPQQLEKAYLELQTKLGKQGDKDSTESTESTEEPEATTEESTDQQDVDYSFLDELWEAAGDQPSEETVNKLQSLNSSEIADMYIAYRQQVESQSQSNNITQEHVDTIHEMVGGEQAYNTLMGWASNNLSDQEQTLYDKAMDSDPVAAFWAARSLALQYADSQGYEGKMLTGKAPKTASGFRSQAELVQAMNDPRYDNDEAYRTDVLTKLQNSNITF